VAKILENNILILKEGYIEILNDMKKIPKTLPQVTHIKEINSDDYDFFKKDRLTNPLSKIEKVKLDAKTELSLNRNIVAYDESIKKFSCLEGEGYLVGHSIIELKGDDYKPTGLLTFNFYTQSDFIVKKSDYVKKSKDHKIDSKKDYIMDRIDFLTKYTPEDSILLIDGPLIGGDVYTYLIRSIDNFLDRNILPVFFVKNSNSNIVTDNIDELKNKYNSDMHWTYNYLNKGERTNFFIYRDKINPNNAKVFCYLKAFNKSPQRIEFHVSSFKKFEDEIDNLINKIYYYIIVQGKNNPQIRPIAIAEKYAREYVKLSNINKTFFDIGLTPTMNQERFGG